MISHRIIDNTGMFELKQSAIDSPEGIAEPLIRYKSAQDAVVRLPHIA